MIPPTIAIRRLGPAETDEFVRLRRQALETEPYSFAASPEDDRAGSSDFVRESLGKTNQAVVGAFDPDLVAVAGVFQDAHRKSAHKAHIWGVYVVPSYRGFGLGRALVEAAVEFAATLPGVTHVHLVASEQTPGARALYQSVGFKTWGVEPDGLRINGALVPDHHMFRILHSRE
jgi:ribosomal protein S18 acetylase RimI-like enzyme